ncbi:MAG: hypothetical protein KHX03_02375 [Clostridium sp.]|nr:hypothetical protein [Clostridium sp.]
MSTISCSSYENYNRYQQDRQQKPEQRKKIYYGSGAPEDKRGKEISEEDYKKLEEQKVGAKFIKPKQSTIKKSWIAIKKWFNKQAEKPHKIDVEDIKEKTKTIKDIYDTYQKINQQNNPNNNQVQ